MVLAGHDIEGRPVYVCPTCGFTVVGDPPAKCPVCAEPSQNFAKF
jgi:rubrerythrin